MIAIVEDKKAIFISLRAQQMNKRIVKEITAVALVSLLLCRNEIKKLEVIYLLRSLIMITK